MKNKEKHISKLRERILSDFAELPERFLDRTNYQRMLCIDDECVIDDIILFEHLEEDFYRMVEKRNLNIFQPLPRANTTKRLPWQSYYDEELTSIVQERFKFDIELYTCLLGQRQQP